jgi:hypothetical protein
MVTPLEEIGFGHRQTSEQDSESGQSTIIDTGHPFFATQPEIPSKGIKPPSQTRKSFLHNRVGQIVAFDFFTIPTPTFRNLYCLIILPHGRRSVVRFNVSAPRTAGWNRKDCFSN